MRLKIYLSALLILFSMSINANEVKGSIQGLVIDAQTGLPMEGATISIPEVKLSTLTNKSGEYTFKSLPEGTFTIMVSFVGYKTIAETIIIKSELSKDFSLQPSIVENENVTVTGVSSSSRISRSPVQVTIFSNITVRQTQN
ncbi:MAG TPA: carboxypeptidase-like regulatory domain-containing protein [Niabella sp.]|nr:carboxypeptidase-like regulatory domain-containing protein [Niabella sp.]HQX42289.1 carboxypeptidase-like regulatory domain-containing protein [Niabella sp.]HRB35699.1 carboxypeptidase-like regulatory domain-containing protein [Niabella sp.]HRB42175.1 carboxypeptidase-like regulatory domain-containing protein [Niabella sp.]HRB65045.1 carboxypeptidase-like regulatory domain-containing protein [Niabella sp.]